MGLKLGDTSPLAAAVTGEGFASNFGTLPYMHAREKKKEEEERKKQSGMKKGGKVNKYAKGGDVQSESSKLDQKNAAMDKAQEEGRKRYEKEEIESNQAPRKAVSDAVDYVKGKAKQLGEFVGKEARNYGRTYKKGLGMEPDTPYEKKKGGVIKSSASSRGDGIAQRGKTKGRMV